MENQSLDKLVSYKKGFASARILSVIAILGAFGFSGFVWYKSTQQIEKLTESGYYIDADGSVKEIVRETYTEDMKKLECIDHVMDATVLINGYDEGTIDDNLDKASYYFGDCFVDILDKFEEKKIKQRFQNDNLYTTVDIHADSVVIDMSTLTGTVSYVQNIKKAGVKSVNRAYNRVEFTLDTSFPRSPENRHGIKIVSWLLIHSEKLQ